MAQFDEALGSLFFTALIGLGAYVSLSNDSWSNSLWYSTRYHITQANVQTDVRPDDCDFLRAPLGSKGCSYKAHLEVLNADGVQVAGDDAPKFSSDTKTAKPIVSYDGGKTWNWYEGAVPDPKPNRVRVLWVKE